jgi:glutathione S-transferase
VLYRCPTPTNVLCPCGAVARRLRKLELDYRTERVPYRRASRPEIVELTRQRRVPVLVDDEEVVHDSKRIVQYLDWKYGREERDQPEGGKEATERDRRFRLYNVKLWRRRRKQSS